MLLMITYHGRGLYVIGLTEIIYKYYDFFYALICVVLFEIYFAVIAPLFCNRKFNKKGSIRVWCRLLLKNTAHFLKRLRNYSHPYSQKKKKKA